MKLNGLLPKIIDTLQMVENTVQIQAVSVWGALRGLESFIQLVVEDDDRLVGYSYEHIVIKFMPS
jgi:hypothetical protein